MTCQKFVPIKFWQMCNDIHECQFQGVKQEEKKFGGQLLDKPKQIPFQDGGHNLCLTIEELAPGWRSKLAANYQVGWQFK